MSQDGRWIAWAVVEGGTREDSGDEEGERFFRNDLAASFTTHIFFGDKTLPRMLRKQPSESLANFG